MIVDNGKYYLYRYIRLDKNEPFYIGVGTKGKRDFIKYSGEYNRAFSKNRNSIWKKIISKTDYEVEILLESNDYSFIEKKEEEFIKLYGRINNGTGTLANLNDYGKGGKGMVVSEENRRKISKRNKRYSMSEEQKRKLSEINKGKRLSEETKRKISKTLTGRKISREAIEKAKLKTVGRKRSEEVIRLFIEQRRGRVKEEKIIEMINKGYSDRKIARDCPCSPWLVRKIKKEIKDAQSIN